MAIDVTKTYYSLTRGDRQWLYLWLAFTTVIAAFSAPFTCRYHGVLLGWHPPAPQMIHGVSPADDLWCSPDAQRHLRPAASQPAPAHHSTMNNLIITGSMLLTAPLQVLLIPPSAITACHLTHEPIPDNVILPAPTPPPRMI
ncbi:MAG: hypothetical protein IT322_16945 [Anaerolineae bacterium]|nr:hypothetical protein [Anaerolineae bacterium]CAG1015527.1 hypothetical protein ANRL4_05518 [Anaerolineae bacterium]